MKALSTEISGTTSVRLDDPDFLLPIEKRYIGEPVNFWNRDRYPCAFRMGEYKEYMRTHHPERHAFLYA